MKIAELKKLRTLAATPKMMRMAAEDKLEKITTHQWGYDYVHEKWRYALFMRCQVLNGILKVSFFLPDAMRLGGKLPAYELFINKETAEFITYDRNRDRWLEAKLDRLDWPKTVHSGVKRWINSEGYRSTKRYLGTEKGGYEGILDYQLAIRNEQLKLRHKRETDPWDRDLAQTPALPKDWERWVDQVGIMENYIFYKYVRGGAKTGWCTFCGKDVPIVRPRHNKTWRCRCCRHEVTFKAVGKMAGVLLTPECHMYLLQRCTDGLMIREFRGYRKYIKDHYRQPEVCRREIRRAIFDAKATPLRAYSWGDYKHCALRWIESSVCNPNWTDEESGRCYGKTIPTLAARELRFTGLPEMLRARGSIAPEKYLAVRSRVPQLEQLAKAGLYGLAKDCIERPYTFQELFRAPVGGLTKQLGLDAQAMKRLRENNGGLACLKWLQYEKTTGKPLPDQTIRWLCREQIEERDLRFILDRMRIPQVCSYLRRQMAETGMSSSQVLTTWKDYLAMAARLRMDTHDAIIYRVRKLRQRHGELVEQCQMQELSIEAGRVLEQYPHMEEIFGAIRETYTYSDEQFSILVPEQIEEIMQEGRNLHHCVSSSNRYWERIERHESYILFLRRTAEPQKSWYTLEVEPDGAVRQKRTLYDRQDDGIEAATSFLRKWQKEVSKRITEAERRLAEKSRTLRMEEFAQLQRDQVVIHNGELQGRRLADVLLADLMENKEEAAALPAAA